MDRLNHAHTFIPGEAGETIQGMVAGPGLPRLESQIQWAHGPGGRVRGVGGDLPLQSEQLARGKLRRQVQGAYDSSQTSECARLNR